MKKKKKQKKKMKIVISMKKEKINEEFGIFLMKNKIKKKEKV